MGSPGASRDTVGESIQRLEADFGSFPVNQTTLSLSPDAYADARERAEVGVADLYVRVRNEGGEVLHVRSEESPRVPRCVGTRREQLATRARDAVRERTGVVCAVTDVARVTIAGVRNAEDPDASTVYRLLVLFEATRVGGDATGGVWLAEASTPVFV